MTSLVFFIIYVHVSNKDAFRDLCERRWIFVNKSASSTDCIPHWDQLTFSYWTHHIWEESRNMLLLQISTELFQPVLSLFEGSNTIFLPTVMAASWQLKTPLKLIFFEQKDPSFKFTFFADSNKSEQEANVSIAVARIAEIYANIFIAKPSCSMHTSTHTCTTVPSCLQALPPPLTHREISNTRGTFTWHYSSSAIKSPAE